MSLTDSAALCDSCADKTTPRLVRGMLVFRVSWKGLAGMVVGVNDDADIVLPSGPTPPPQTSIRIRSRKVQWLRYPCEERVRHGVARHRRPEPGKR